MRLKNLQRAVKFRGSEKTRKSEATNKDLRHAIVRDYLRALAQTRKIAPKFQGSSIRETAGNVHRFIRKNFLYLQDSGEVQRLKLPSALLRALVADCKSFAIFAAAILKNIYQKTGDGRFRFAAYKKAKYPSHVYTVITDEYGNDVIIDGTNPNFNTERPPSKFIDKSLPMKITTIAGEDQNTLYSLAEEVLADDETLSRDSSRLFVRRLRRMSPRGRKSFLRKFNPRNRAKLSRSVKSFVKLRQMRTQPRDRYAPPGGWGFGVAGYDGDNEEEVITGKRKKRRQARRRGRKAKRTERKAARKSGVSKKRARAAGRSAKAREKAKEATGSRKRRLEAKEMKARGKATGDKELQARGKKLRRQVMKDRLKKIPRALARFNPVLAIGRGAFLGMVRLNLRGLASNMKMMMDKGETASLFKKWGKLGGKTSRIKAAIKKGATKKALLGRKKISDELDYAYNELGIGAVGIAGGATAAAAAPIIAALIPLIKKFLKKEGITLGKKTGDKITDAKDKIKGAILAMKETFDETQSTEGKKGFGKFVDRISGFIADRPVLNDIKNIAVDKWEEMTERNISGEEPEQDETPNGEEDTQMNYLLPAVGLGALYLFTRKKAA